MDTKHCTGCSRDLPMEAFNYRGGGEPGRRARCIACDSARHARNRAAAKAREAKEVEVFAEIRRQDIAATNAFALWHGPVSRGEPLRWLA